MDVENFIRNADAQFALAKGADKDEARRQLFSEFNSLSEKQMKDVCSQLEARKKDEFNHRGHALAECRYSSTGGQLAAIRLFKVENGLTGQQELLHIDSKHYTNRAMREILQPERR